MRKKLNIPQLIWRNMQITCLTVWDRRIRELGVRLQESEWECVCPNVCLRERERDRQRERTRERVKERDFDSEVWTCVSRLASVAPDRHTQAQRHTYRGVWHIPEADPSSVHALQWAIVLHILKWALGMELSLQTHWSQSQPALTSTHTVLRKAGFCVWRLKCGEANRPWHQLPCYSRWKENFYTFSSVFKAKLKSCIWTSVLPCSEGLRVKCWILPSSDLLWGNSCSFFSGCHHIQRLFSLL